jgi:hypothetical protein
MSVSIAGQQYRLEKHHAGVPNNRRPAQSRQQYLGDQGPDEEEERGADEKCYRIEDHQGLILRSGNAMFHQHQVALKHCTKGYY